MSENAPIAPVEEVTLVSSTNVKSQAIKWCFTHHNCPIESEDDLIYKKLIPLFNKIAKFYIFSVEIGSLTKKRHIQGYIEFKCKKRLSECKKIIDDTTHWEKSKGSKDQNIIYVSKDPIKGPFSFDDGKKLKYSAEELDLITEEMLYDWQKGIIEMIGKKAAKRVIYWYWSKEGSIGKTEFVKYLMFHYKAKFCQGAKKDIMCSILGKDGTNDARPIYIFGYPRTVEDKVSYDGLESVKDGLLFSSKYESGDALIPIPHVLVFANFPPKRAALSADRWVVECLDYAPGMETDNISNISIDDYDWD